MRNAWIVHCNIWKFVALPGNVRKQSRFLCFCAGSVVSFHIEHASVILSVLIVSLVTTLNLLICLNLKVVRFYDIKIKHLA